MSIPSRYCDAKRPELLPRNPGAEAVECPDPAIGEKQEENERKKISQIFTTEDMKITKSRIHNPNLRVLRDIPGERDESRES